MPEPMIRKRYKDPCLPLMERPWQRLCIDASFVQQPLEDSPAPLLHLHFSALLLVGLLPTAWETHQCSARRLFLGAIVKRPATPQRSLYTQNLPSCLLLSTT